MPSTRSSTKTIAGEVVNRLRRLLKKGERTQESFSINDLVRSTAALLHGELVSRDISVKLDLEGYWQRRAIPFSCNKSCLIS